jgi:hypothetical protein
VQPPALETVTNSQHSGPAAVAAVFSVASSARSASAEAAAIAVCAPKIWAINAATHRRSLTRF